MHFMMHVNMSGQHKSGLIFRITIPTRKNKTLTVLLIGSHDLRDKPGKVSDTNKQDKNRTCFFIVNKLSSTESLISRNALLKPAKMRLQIIFFQPIIKRGVESESLLSVPIFDLSKSAHYVYIRKSILGLTD